MTSNKKSIEETYKKLTLLEQILLRPQTYIGSTEIEKKKIWVYEDKMIKKEITFIPGLLKLFDEILVNAVDHSVVDETVKNIKVDIDKNKVIVWNDGNGIDIEMHKQHKVYVPELIFGHLLTSTNYDEDTERVVGGQNGFGAKLANIFSTEFIIETVDEERQKKYYQVFRNNMNDKEKPKITTCKKKPYTKVTFVPDFERFKISELSDDIIALFKKRVYDVCATTRKTVAVTLNGEKIKVKEFEDYVNLYIGNKKELTRIYETPHERWEICAAYNQSGNMEQISFVNGVWTIEGGTHIQYVLNQIVKKLEAHIKKGKNKDLNIQSKYIKDHLWLFVKSTIVNPSFASQTKEILTTKQSSFGSKFEISEEFIKKLAKTDLVARVISFVQFKDNLDMKKTDGKKSFRLRNIPKLDDANYAGTSKSAKCTLIVVEGDSARTFANSGLAVTGHDYYGIFPLKGKPLNVREATASQQVDNKEIYHIKQILGLQMNKKYETVESLRYGSLMILTDADDDGTHIKGLIMNMFHYWWPDLLKIPGFLKSMVTPVVKAVKGKNEIEFKSLIEYKKWKEENETKGWHIKYYKGLGTSTANEAKYYFSKIDNNQLAYRWDDNTNESICLAFQKDKADDRKEWIRKFDKENSYTDETDIEYNTFIHKELINYSQASVLRAIPAIHDGLKPSQRKVLYCGLIRNLTNEIKVSQFSGSVSEKSAYHHGEMSLQGTIINMAQNYVGSNNINLFYPSGQFGTRLLGGKDAASPRYIFTKLSSITKLLFDNRDFPILNQLDDDGFKIEPEWYLPILPTVLINGVEGIATGYSTKIPQYNPIDIINNIKLLIKGDAPSDMIPYYRGFTGEIVEDGKNYKSIGKYCQIDHKVVKITELPIGVWTYTYQEYLEKLVIDPKKKTAKQCLRSYNCNNTDTTIDIELVFPTEAVLNKLMKNIDKFEQLFKLSTKINTTNMYLYSTDNTIKKYDNVCDILIDYYEIRLQYYQKRKDYLLIKLKKELDILKAKIRFITEIMNDTIVIYKKSKDTIIKMLEKNNYPKFENSSNEFTYEYLLDMKIITFTKEKLDELKNNKKEKDAEYKELKSKDNKVLWLDDLNLFEKEYEKHLKEYEKMMNEGNKFSKKKGKKGKK